MEQIGVAPKQAKRNEFYASAYDFKFLSACDKKFYFNKLKISLGGNEAMHFAKEMVYRMLEIIQCDSSAYEAKVKELFCTEFQKDWYGTLTEYNVEFEKYLYMVLRIGRYIIEEGYKVIGIKKRFRSPFGNKPLFYKGIEIDGICDKHDFVLEKENELVLVSLFSGKPEYSSAARKKERMVDASVELMISTLGGYLNYPERNFTAQLWYMGNKDDKGNTMLPFEHRHEKNIIHSIYDGYSANEVFSKFLSYFVSQKGKGDCSESCKSCVYSQICKIPNIRLEKEYIMQEEEKQMSKCFTEAQQEVIDHVNGPLCCIAVPGAGKTTALVERLAALVRKGVRPEKILMLTFTKKAAKEIEERIAGILPGRNLPSISTYNALGFSILKENPLYVGGKRLKLADDVDRYHMIYAAIRQTDAIKGMSYTFVEGEHGIIRILDKFFDEIQKKGEEKFRTYYKETKDVDGILRVYHIYKKLYNQNGYISYDEQISKVNELFDEYPELIERYGNRYEYIMVDEFQDTSHEQAELIYAIARVHNNLVVVGDDDQSIYNWRGGSSKFMLEFEKDFPNAKKIFMEDNFRSRNAILQLAGRVIMDNGIRYNKNLLGHRDGLEKPLYVKGVPTDLCQIISNLVDDGVSYGDICILARNNKRLQQVQEMLGDKYPVSLPKDYLVEDGVFIGILDVLELYYSSGSFSNDASFYRLLRLFGAEKEVVAKEKIQDSLYETLVKRNKIPEMIFNAKTIHQLHQESKKNPCMAACYHILRCFESMSFDNISISLEKILQELFGISKHPTIEKLRELSEERGITKIADLYMLMKDMKTFCTTTRVGYSLAKDAINLYTCHDAKGKEFKHVVFYGIEDMEDDAESIRVLYVAITRAKDSLYLLETSEPKHNSIQKKMGEYVRIVGCEG